MDKIDQNLITLYRVDFNFTKSINKVILQDLVEELDVKEKAWSLEKEKTEEKYWWISLLPSIASIIISMIVILSQLGVL